MRAAIALPSRPNERWSLDFVSDSFTDSRRFRVLAVVDDFTRECLALVADTSLSGARVARELDVVRARRGQPKTCVSDNGTELEEEKFKWPVHLSPLASETARPPVVGLDEDQFLWLLDGLDLKHLKPHRSLEYRSVL
jgi:hypothetical protein